MDKKTWHWSGLSGTALKVVALLLMTIDHVGAYGEKIPIIGNFGGLERLIGRIAAPIFLFVVVQSAHKTKRKSRYLLRLYLWSVCCGQLNAVVSSAVFQSMVSFSNILQAYVWVVAIAYAADHAIVAAKDRKLMELLPLLGVLVLFSVSKLIDRLMCNTPVVMSVLGINEDQAMLALEVTRSFLCPVTGVEYGIWFVALGLIWYLLDGEKWKCCISFIALWGIGMLLWGTGIDASGWYSLFYGDGLYSIGCVPFLLLYNGSYGSGHKRFFYLYYILHRYVIHGLSVLFSIAGG